MPHNSAFRPHIPDDGGHAFIVIDTDEAVARDRSLAPQGLMDRAGLASWDDAKDLVARALRPTRLPLLAFPASWPGGIIAAAVERATENATFEDMNVRRITRAEASQLCFPLGAARARTLYARHPKEGNRYLPFADFHKFVFGSKAAELEKLLMSLGATYIRIEHIKGWSKTANGNLTVTRDGVAQGGSVSGSGTTGANVISESRLDGNPSPSIPDGLVWFPDEDAWNSLAYGVLQCGQRLWNYSFEYVDDFSVNASMKAWAEGAGIDIGGSFIKHEKTIWKVVAEFGRL